MSLTIGTPEYVLISSACAQMAHYYGIPYRSSGSLTDAKELDAQAGMESAMNLTFGLCEGVDFMLQSVGIYESFMSLGFDKWILDEEILARIAYIRKGLGDIPEELPEIIHDGVAEGNYLCEPSTLEDFRDELYWPQISDRRDFKHWKDEKGNFRESVWDKVQQRLDSYICPGLPEDNKKDLEKYLMETMGHGLPNW